METKTDIKVSERTAEAVTFYNQMNTLCRNMVRWHARHYGKGDNEKIDDFTCRLSHATESMVIFLQEQITSSVRENVAECNNNI